jgi:hypothetical protein
LAPQKICFGTRYRFTQPEPEPRVPLAVQCLGPGGIAINHAYYRVQPHEQRRYVALALDNIRRAPVDYAWSVLYRAVRLFVIVGTEDRSTAQQFDRSRFVYAAGTLLSSLYLALALLGAWIGWRRGYAVLLPIALILYIPATISFVLTEHALHHDRPAAAADIRCGSTGGGRRSTAWLSDDASGQAAGCGRADSRIGRGERVRDPPRLRADLPHAR